MSILDSLERKIISKIRKHLRVTNEIAHTGDMLDLITTISYDGYIVFSHSLSLNELYEIFKERMAILLLPMPSKPFLTNI